MSDAETLSVQVVWGQRAACPPAHFFVGLLGHFVGDPDGIGVVLIVFSGILVQGAPDTNCAMPESPDQFAQAVTSFSSLEEVSRGHGLRNAKTCGNMFWQVAVRVIHCTSCPKNRIRLCSSTHAR